MAEHPHTHYWGLGVVVTVCTTLIIYGILFEFEAFLVLTAVALIGTVGVYAIGRLADYIIELIT